MKKLKILGITSIFVLSGILVGAGNAVVIGHHHHNGYLEGLFLGGGTIGFETNPRVTHGFMIHDSIDESPNILIAIWEGNHFFMTALMNVEFFDDPGIDPRPPQCDFDTVHGWGEGRVNGMSEYNVEFIFTDAGEPGHADWAWIRICDSSGNIVMEVSGFLKNGNQQAINI